MDCDLCSFITFLYTTIEIFHACLTLEFDAKNNLINQVEPKIKMMENETPAFRANLFLSPTRLALTVHCETTKMKNNKN